jgi:hypothetical protein
MDVVSLPGLNPNVSAFFLYALGTVLISFTAVSAGKVKDVKP